jgi:hypothetical protein
MSLTYRSKRNHLEFYANVAGASYLGKVHRILGLPHLGGDWGVKGKEFSMMRAPYEATAKQCREWSRVLWTALEVFTGAKNLREAKRNRMFGNIYYLATWADFLQRCSGYRGD